MRLILLTGKGGAGASTLAAASAVTFAGSGRRTLAFGVGHGLAAAFGRPLGRRPVPLAADLWALEAMPGRHNEPGPSLDWLRDLFAYRNMDETVADDIAALPGVVDLARLLALDDQVESGRFDAVVVDFPALRHTLDLLAALDAAARSLGRMFPPRQPTMLDPFLRALSGSASDGEDVYERGRELLLRLSRLRGTLSDPDSASVRLVLTADQGSLAEAQRAVTALSLFAYPADAAFCNRLLPDEAGPWAGARREDQREALNCVADALAPLPVLSAPLQPRDVAGLADLATLGGLAYGWRDPAAVPHSGPAQAFSRNGEGYVLSLALPFVEREELAIERLDDALIVHVG